MNPQLIFQGHSGRVFNVAFHPICPQLIASRNDDKTVCVWNWSPEAQGNHELRSLTGHQSHVRGALLWHTELPNISFTGAWESTIRIWDVATGLCIRTRCEHYADIYGLTLHPQRPSVLVSSSRDTTVWFWVFEDQVRPLLAQALVRPDRLTELLGTPPEASRALLSGIQGPILAGQQLDMQVYQRSISFFVTGKGLRTSGGCSPYFVMSLQAASLGGVPSTSGS